MKNKINKLDTLEQTLADLLSDAETAYIALEKIAVVTPGVLKKYKPNGPTPKFNVLFELRHWYDSGVNDNYEFAAFNIDDQGNISNYSLLSSDTFYSHAGALAARLKSEHKRLQAIAKLEES